MSSFMDVPGVKAAATAAAVNKLGMAGNPVTDPTAPRPTGLTVVWWATPTQPTNWANGDLWVVTN